MIKPKDILAAATAFKAALNAEVVDPGTIQKRLSVCGGCKKRQLTRGVASNTSYILGMLANRHRVPREIAGYSCNVCGCSLLLLVPALKKDLHVDSEKESNDRPDNCWINES